MLGDKAYSVRAHRALLRARGMQNLHPRTLRPGPQPQTTRLRRRPRPPAFDAHAYRDRNVVELSFNTVKQWRCLATRYDKLAIVYRGAAVLWAITIWLKNL